MNEVVLDHSIREVPHPMAAPETPVDTDRVTLTPEQQKEQLDHALSRLDKIAESQLEMAQLFISRGKIEIARRLQEILDLHGQTDAASEARKLLKRS